MEEAEESGGSGAHIGMDLEVKCGSHSGRFSSARG